MIKFTVAVPDSTLRSFVERICPVAQFNNCHKATLTDGQLYQLNDAALEKGGCAFREEIQPDGTIKLLRA